MGEESLYYRFPHAKGDQPLFGLHSLTIASLCGDSYSLVKLSCWIEGFQLGFKVSPDFKVLLGDGAVCVCGHCNYLAISYDCCLFI